jgi:cytochrome c biogenesis protein CcdA
MSIGLASLALAGGAGVLSTLSPCVLPILPILLAGAQSSHRLGPLALAAGLAAAFTTMGVLVAGLGASIGFDQTSFRMVAALVLLVLGIVLLSTKLQQHFARLTQRFGDVGQAWSQRIAGNGWTSQLLLGLTLGLVWSPCVGPTLGAAITLASQGSNLVQVSFVMLLFGAGAALPLLGLSLLSRSLIQRVRGGLLGAGQIGKQILGMLLVVLGLMVISGGDHRLEAALLDISPSWLTTLTTSL